MRVSRIIRRACSALACFFLAARPALGQTWVGQAPNATWDFFLGFGNTYLNWNDNKLPANSANVVFGDGFDSGDQIDLNGDRVVNSLIINSPNSFSLEGFTLRLNSGTLTRTSNTRGTQQISSRVILGADGSFDINGSGALGITGVIDEAGGPRSLTKTGSGTLIISGAPVYTGSTTVSGGTLEYAIEAGTVVLGTDPSLNLSIDTSATLNAGGSVNPFADDVRRLDIHNDSQEGGFNITAGVKETGAIDGQGLLSIVGTDTLLSATRVRQQKISIGDGSTLALRRGGGSDATSETVELTIEGSGKFDVADRALRIQHAGQVDAQQTLADVTGWIKTARNSSPILWQGPGITSSAARGITGLAVLLNNDGKGNRIVTTLNGLEVEVDDILVKFTYNGDMDLNGVVDADDYSRIDIGFANGLGSYSHGDLDYNGTIDADDYALIDLAFASQGAPLTARAVPEPGTLLTAALCAFCIFLTRGSRISNQKVH